MRELRAGRRRWATVLGACAVAVLVAACGGPAVRPLDPSLGAGILTPEANDTYGLTLADEIVTASAAETNEGGNTRIAFWRVADAPSADQQTCSTWVDAHGDLQQQGAGLRVRSANGRTTAITVTDNIWFGARWVFNVHVMDSADEEEPFHQIGSFDLTEVFRVGGADPLEVVPYPWRMCARVVGDVVSFVVWPLSHAEPAWDDPEYGGSVTLPDGWAEPGIPGWYVGHLRASDSVGFTEMATAEILPEPPPPPTTTTTEPTTTSTTEPPTTTTTTEAGAGAVARSDSVGPEPTTPPREPTWIPRAP